MKQRILDATNGGLDIILYYYPQAREVIDGRSKMFKVRPSERTASASLKKYKDMWYVTDFGEDQTGRNCFDIAMKEESLPFNQTLFLLADRYGVESRISAEINKPKVTSRKATAEEKNGDFTYKVKITPSDNDLKVFGHFVKATTLEKYHYYALESYSITKDGKTTTFASTDNYPIFLHDCGDFQKIYKPLEYDKAFRFFYKGKKEKNYINGLDELRAAHRKYLESEEWKSDDSETKGKKKLPEAIFCSGERDAMNCAGMGYFALWLNSETDTLQEKEFNEILRYVDRVYNIPDIDETGIRRGRDFALRYLDIYTVELPEWIKNYRDNRGKPRKDLRDFLELRPNNSEFIKLLNSAHQCKFWSVEETEKGKRTNINTAYLLWFLRCNGFAKITDKVSKLDQYVRIDDYKVEEYTPKQIRSFVKSDLERRMVGTEVINLFLNSKRTNSSLADDLTPTDISFTKNTHNSRTFFFENKSVTVTAKGIEQHQYGTAEVKTWRDNISPHHFKELDKFFNIQLDENGNFLGLDIFNMDSHYFRFLINSSRIFWREEYEYRASNNADEDEQYREQNKFNPCGERLTYEEKIEQCKHLINKIYTVGYLLHRFKFDSKSMAVWIMENKLTEEDESSGGSGKSFFLKAIKKLALSSIVTLQGRDKKATENKHLLDRVSSNTDILLIDDAHRYFDFDFFYTMITGETTVNPKGGKSFEISYEDAPIMAITSNFPPPNDDASTMRRMLNVVFSDYYHQKTSNNDYLESRSIYDDFGYDLFGVNYSEEFYNQDINFMMQCLQFYLSVPRKVVCQPPMENVIKRINIAKMGNSFKDWAESYFSPDNDNLNVLLNRSEVFNTFKVDTGNNNWKMQRFTKALQAFVANSDYIEELNPKELRNSQGRLMRKKGSNNIECIYLKEVGKAINNNFKDYL